MIARHASISENPAPLPPLAADARSAWLLTCGCALATGPGDQMYYCGGQCCPSTSQCVLKLNSEGSFTGLACCPGAPPGPHERSGSGSGSGSWSGSMSASASASGQGRVRVRVKAPESDVETCRSDAASQGRCCHEHLSVLEHLVLVQACTWRVARRAAAGCLLDL